MTIRLEYHLLFIVLQSGDSLRGGKNMSLNFPLTVKRQILVAHK